MRCPFYPGSPYLPAVTGPAGRPPDAGRCWQDAPGWAARQCMRPDGRTRPALGRNPADYGEQLTTQDGREATADGLDRVGPGLG